MKKLSVVLLALSAILLSQISFAQLNMTLLGHLTYSNSLASLWGYAANGKEYALVGAYNGLSIVDVTTPTAPVEVQFVSTNNSFWHEIKVWSHYAYVVNESGGGMLIVDLSNLPNSVTSTNFTGGALNLSTGHTVEIDEHGICYVNGSNLANGGVLFFDLNANPTNPTYLGDYTDHYVHDCFVRGDTMWTSEIYQGWFRAIDVSNKSNPVILAQQSTPGNFNHNSSLSDNGDYLFTTDEVTNSYVTSYNVSALTNITELDRFQANPGTNSIGHNVHVKGNYLVIAYYRDGVVIADATHPENLIKVAYYDTNPLSGNGYNGCWEAYAYLPSGNIIAADIEQGLYVLGVTYTQACYLTGTVTDYATGSALNGVTVSITNASGSSTTTNLSGVYATGYATSGTYSVTFSKSGYTTKTITNVSLSNGVSTVLNTTLKNTSLPQCATPSNLTADNITFTSAMLHWSDEYASNYTIKLKNNGNNQTQTLTATVNSFTAAGLTSCGSYKFRVKAKCSSGGVTSFSGWKNFSVGGASCKEIFEEETSEESAIRIFPNPFVDEFNIVMSLDRQEEVTVNVYDMSGRKMKQEIFPSLSLGTNNLSIDASDLPEGIYLMAIQKGEEVTMKRMVKVKE